MQNLRDVGVWKTSLSSDVRTTVSHAPTFSPLAASLARRTHFRDCGM